MNGLDSPYPLTGEDVRQYRENGHVHLRGVCTGEEITAFREVLKSVTAERFAGASKMSDRVEDDFSRVFMQTFNLREADERAARFIQSSRFGKIAADLMGVDAVRIYYDKAMFKEPESWITPWHQDGPHWPLCTDHVLTMWIPLVDATIDMGPPRFASGTHRGKVLGPKGIHRESESFTGTTSARTGFRSRKRRFAPETRPCTITGWYMARGPTRRAASVKRWVSRSMRTASPSTIPRAARRTGRSSMRTWETGVLASGPIIRATRSCSPGPDPDLILIWCACAREHSVIQGSSGALMQSENLVEKLRNRRSRLLDPEADALTAAVAVLLRGAAGGTELLFLQRAQREGDPWSGHISFPGGKIDASDENPRQAAIRETREETAIDLDHADFVCRLDDQATHLSKVRVAGFVFYLANGSDLTLNHEIRNAFWFPLADLKDETGMLRPRSPENGEKGK